MNNKKLQNNQKIFNEKFLYNKQGRNVLYVHTPFCLSRCAYCIYHYSKFENPQQIDDYYNFLSTEISENFDVLQKVHFEQIYFGGGTPTVASPQQLEFLYEKIPNFSSIPNKISEASPNTLTEEHIKVFQKNQFRFISIGVQSLNKAICKKQNRYWIPKVTLKHYVNLIREAGMYVNLDFICFLNFGDLRDVPQFFGEIDMVLKEIKPTFITIHTLHQSVQSIERSKIMIERIRAVLEKNQDYMCVNSTLEDDEALTDAFYSTEYRLGLKGNDYSHYMFNKYAVIPVEGYNIYALGNYGNIQLTANTGKFVYLHNEEESDLFLYQYDPFVRSSYETIRQSIGFDDSKSNKV